MSAPAVSADDTQGQRRHRAGTPQRYSSNYTRYLSLGGQVRVEELMRGFMSGDRNQDDIARFFFFCLVFDQLSAEAVEGDMAELGVYKGNTATLLSAAARKLGRTAYLLDTFEGFHPEDMKEFDAASAGRFGDTSLDAVRTLVGEDNVCYVKGHFPDTAGQLPADGRYCLVHIDCDLYAPIRSGLEYFYPRLMPGGFLIVHDYSSLWYNGPQKAVDEFFADKVEAPIPLPDSAGSVVVRKARSPNTAGNWLVRKRASLLRDEWTEAANGALRELLGSGWGAPEDWGVWGVGDMHELHVVCCRPVPIKIEVDMDVHVVLAGRRTTQQVEVLTRGEMLALWEFTSANNRGVRSVSIPIAPPAATADGYEQVTLMFRPRSMESPQDLTPDLHDTRPLGLALHRIRCRM